MVDDETAFKRMLEARRVEGNQILTDFERLGLSLPEIRIEEFKGNVKKRIRSLLEN